ncbi:MAG TPA: flagellar export chaperone FlgN, partial [Pirellulaceae bacterium]|nr:flagellar export chaperone FlgN [Pirellulaceae bacterium]
IGLRQATLDESNATDGTWAQPPHAIQQAYHALAEQFAPVAHGRQAMLTALSTLKGMPSGTVTISRLTSRLSPPLRDELHHLRNTVKAKVLDIQAMIMGNQAILMYTMDFFGRLLTSLTGELEPAQAYNARGQLSSSANASIVKQQC